MRKREEKGCGWGVYLNNCGRAKEKDGRRVNLHYVGR